MKKSFMIIVVIANLLAVFFVFITERAIDNRQIASLAPIVTVNEQMNNCIKQGGVYEIQHNTYHTAIPEYEESCTIPRNTIPSKELWKNEIKID
jgi:hypothetical protein